MSSVPPMALMRQRDGAPSSFFGDASDSRTRRFKRGIVQVITGAGAVQLLAWGAAYWYFREYGPALVALLWAAGCLGLLACATRGWLAERQVVLVGLASNLVGNLLLTLLLGGLLGSCGQLVWVLLVPVGGIIYGGPRAGRLLLAAAAVVLVSATLLDPYVTPTHAIPPRVQALMLAFNIATPMVFISLTLAVFRDHEVELVEMVKAERRRSEALLLRVFPAGVAARLRDGEGVIADHHGSVSILFADLANFTTLSASLPAGRLVAMLNDVFSGLDLITKEYGAEKIKTIGDCYMAAAGLPDTRADHAAALADVALAFLAYLKRSAAGEYGLEFRVGISSGPVVAGVIGRDRFAYDLWGDTVNMASRMESHGVVGRIQVSGETREALGGRYDCEPRGIIPVKGKGEVETWFLVGRKPPAGPG